MFILKSFQSDVFPPADRHDAAADEDGRGRHGDQRVEPHQCPTGSSIQVGADLRESRGDDGMLQSASSLPNMVE